MPNIIITIHEDRLTIDGSLPEGYRLVVHNHSGNSDLYPYTQARSACRNDESDEEVNEEHDGVECYLYVEDVEAGLQL
jgi:hypothetical protein